MKNAEDRPLNLIRGLTFQERHPSDNDRIEINAALQRDRAALWSDPHGLTGGIATSCDRWIESGISPKTLALVQGETGESLANRVETPEWIRLVHRAAAKYAGAGSEFSKRHEQDSEREMLRPIQFVVDYFVDLLRIELMRLGPTVGGDAFECGAGNLTEPPHRTLFEAVSQACCLEMQLAWQRSPADRSLSPAEHFRAVLSEYSRIECCLEFLSIYPSLAKNVVGILSRWFNATLELAQRLSSDAGELMQAFDVSTRLEAIDWAAGETHDNGRSVAVLTFESGRKLVYKPRPMQVDEAFGSAVCLVNSRSCIELRVPRVLPREQYGWSEYVDQKPCRSAAEARNFFRRQGALLATLHFFGATDMHCENLVACGEFPLCVDLETVIQPCAPEMDQSVSSVVSVGMLPAPIIISRGGEVMSIDVSGLDGGAPRNALLRESYLIDYGTDRMRVGRRSVTRRKTRNQPHSCSGTPYRSVDFIDQISQGFRAQYDVMMTLRCNSPLESALSSTFARAMVRYVLRPTMVYVSLLSESWNPDLLQDGLDRSFYWEVLSALPLDGHITREAASRILDYEIECLERNDVPAFRSLGGDRHLREASGEILVANFFEISAVDNVRRRLQEASLADREFQTRAIEDALGSGSR